MEKMKERITHSLALSQVLFEPRSRASLVVTFLAMLFLTSCFENQGSGGRRGLATSEGGQATKDEPNSPDFSSSLNFLQNGESQSTSAMTLSVAFNDSLYLRGKQIDQFIRNGNASTIQCIVAPFPSSADKTVLVMSATPRFLINFSNNTREYYYLLTPGNGESNESFCQKTGLINQIDLTYNSSDIAYRFRDLCPNCFEALFVSQSLALYDPSGAPTTNVSLQNLTLRLTNTPGSDLPPGATCTSSSECRAKGFDCCSENQCVKDREVKSSVDQSSAEFLQALSDIQANAANIFNYPNLFHLCSQFQPNPDEPPEPTDPEEEERLRFTRLQELHSCTTPIEGEMAICTVSYDDASEASSNVFFTGTDDRSFTSTYTGSVGLIPHSITRITYAGTTLFEAGEVPLNGAEIGPNNSQVGNDNLDDPLQVRLLKTPSADAPNDTLKISYKIDGSCRRISTGLAQCTKHYVQGQNLGRVDDHFPASNQFMLPYYADLNRTIRVEVDGTTKNAGSQWQLLPTSPAYIDFLGNGLQVFDTQTVKITFFVNTNTHNVLDQMQASLDKIKNICQCADDRCRLRPVKDANNIITDYSCEYPDPDVPPPPLQQTVLMSSKTTPHLYFDELGVYQNNVQIGTAPQEGALFEYINNDLLRPNNVQNTIGFNEIYGSYTTKPGSTKPATEVRVERGKTYDIFVDSGSFSSCLNCGNDYFSNLRRLFPNSFANPGGGYTPNLKDTDRTRVADFRGDDLIFGRACFVPATMIPWSHSAFSDTQTQRMRRLATQHFYYSNGYKRDWYGFDYGSIIGSFDGVRWFSVGTQRRIRANSNRLFLAVNAYHGDLTQETTFKIVVSDASNIPASGSTVSNDFESDGAQCQQLHVCSTDRDCASKLGWEYKCESITNLYSPWPMFDANGSEIPNASNVERLQALFGANLGGPRRCVYRGRGASCQPNLELTQFSSTFNQSTSPGSLGCSMNNYCQTFTDGGEVNRFNIKTARFGRSVANQNASPVVPESNLDTFGLGARIIGRPYTWIGENPTPTEVLSNMIVNNVQGMCLPGRNPQAITINSQNSSLPPGQFQGDKVLAMGVTTDGLISERYLNACSIFDTDGNYYHFKESNINNLSLAQTNSSRLRALASTQALPTNALKVFESILEERVTRNFETEQITSYALQENRCLRAPGSVCQTNQDCAPNRLIVDFLRNIDPRDEALHSSMNMYEMLFWKEELVCGQASAKDSDDFDLQNNRCCRETGNRLTIGTFIDQFGFASQLSSTEAPIFAQELAPGIDIPLNSPVRSSRMAPVRFDHFNNPSQFPWLEVPRENSCDYLSPDPSTSACAPVDSINRQYNTLHKVAGSTCCSGHWIRNWHPEDNGGGHRWEQGRTQFVNKENFKCLNWIRDPDAAPFTSTASRAFNCTHAEEPDDPDCFARSVTNFQATPILEWASKFELLGIPQVAIESDDFSNLWCSVNPENAAQVGDGIIIPGFVEPLSPSVGGEFFDGEGNYYSAAAIDNFSPQMRRIFSPDQFSCCLPAGTEVPPGTNRDQCCTGFINGVTGRCALPDFTNVSLYLNRYVSSEGANLNENVYDPKSGYIKSPSIVEQIACQKRICASGTLIRGVAHSPLPVKGHENSDKFFRRFLDGNDLSNNINGLAQLFEEGLRWNNHVYCSPQAIETEDPTIVVVQCPNL